jgi:hypothetical protein
MDIKRKINDIIFPLIKLCRPRGIFIFNDKSYEYFIHKNSWNSERVVEIPIILSALENNKEKRILEFGNVLEQFIPINWDVLDKYSNGSRVIHKDIVDFNPKEKYDLIVSISTLEHVGFNEEVEDIGHKFDIIDHCKIRLTLEHIKENCLKPKGKMIFTMPVGYNKYMDRNLLYDNLDFDNLYFMRRITGDNKWIQIKFEDFSFFDKTYGYPFNNANYICVGVYDNTKNI